jgi:hypothetical protein
MLVGSDIPSFKAVPETETETERRTAVRRVVLVTFGLFDRCGQLHSTGRLRVFSKCSARAVDFGGYEASAKFEHKSVSYTRDRKMTGCWVRRPR